MKKKVRITEESNDENYEILNEIMKDAIKENLHFVDRVSEVTEQIWRLLEAKGWKQIDLANAMSKSPAEISKLLTGNHNFTMRTITHIETVLGEDVFYTTVGRALENKRLGRTEYSLYSTVNSNNRGGDSVGAFDSAIPCANEYSPAKAS